MVRLSALSLALNRPGAVGLTLEQAVAALFANNEQGAWYDPSGNNTTWRRNRLTYTQEIENAAWGGVSSNQVTVSANQTTAPDGTTTAELVAETADNLQHNLFTQDGGFATSASGIAYTMSVYLKKGPGATAPNVMQLTLRSNGFGTAQYANFSLVGGGVLSSAGGTASIESVGNGWYRCVWTAVSTTAATNSGIGIIFCNNTSNATRTPTYVGSTTSNVYVWGAQLEEGFVATPYQRIITPEITYLSTVQAQPLLFQDAGGTLPVTEVEQPVGLMLDRRKGGTLGPELISNGDFSNGSTGWTLTGFSVVGGEIATDGVTGTPIAQQLISLTANTYYRVTFTIRLSASVSTVYVRLNSTSNVGSQVVSTTPVTFSQVLLASSDPSGLRIICAGLGATIAYVDNISVKLLDGNHAYQTGSTARPVLRARYNLLEYSEQFNNGWNKANLGATDNAAVAPDGTTTADKVYILNATASTLMRRTLTPPANVVCTLSVYAKAAGYNYVNIGFSDGSSSAAYAGAQFDLSNNGALTYSRSAGGYSIVGTPTSTPVAGYAGWYRCSITLSGPNGRPTIHPNSTAWSSGTMEASQTGNGVDGILVWGADLRVGTSAGDYQRIEAAPTAGGGAVTYATTSTMGGEVFRPYLWFDGADDDMIIANTDGLNFGQGSFWAQTGLASRGAAEYDVVWGKGSNASADNIRLFITSANALGVFWGMDSQYYAQTGSITKEATQIQEWGVNASAPQAFYAINGTEYTPSITLSGTGSNTSIARIGVDTSGGYRTRMDLYGMIIRKGTIPSATDRGNARRYMASKSGVTL